ncbi:MULTISPECIES: hypothetical protein [unclassified Ensifer]|uniref:hypothetical protein n=1 Tax=unclassified Ensifer TaxID=2633371 RepID=UPI00111216EF|nr:MULTISPECIES: hypothetical protein [unclassified Ensifer]
MFMVSSLETAWAFGVSAKLAWPSRRRLGEWVKTTKLFARQFLKIRKEKIYWLRDKYICRAARCLGLRGQR